MKQTSMKALLAVLLLVPAVTFAQAGDSASRIKKKASTEAAAQDPDVNFTPFTPLEAEATPAAPTCVQPPVVKAFSAKEKADKFNAALNDYQACVKNYVDVHGKAANQHAEASNKAVADANAYFNALSSKSDKPAGE